VGKALCGVAHGLWWLARQVGRGLLYFWGLVYGWVWLLLRCVVRWLGFFVEFFTEVMAIGFMGLLLSFVLVWVLPQAMHWVLPADLPPAVSAPTSAQAKAAGGTTAPTPAVSASTSAQAASTPAAPDAAANPTEVQALARERGSVGANVQVVEPDFNSATVNLPLLVALWFLITVVWTMLQLQRNVTDSPVFLQALGRWQALLPTTLKSPREWRRLSNMARLFAMRVRVQSQRTWRQRLAAWWYPQEPYLLKGQVPPEPQKDTALDEGLAVELWLMDYVTDGQVFSVLEKRFQAGPVQANDRTNHFAVFDRYAPLRDTTCPVGDFFAALQGRVPQQEKDLDEAQAREQLGVWLALYQELRMPLNAGG
jgi:hypothetical protein